MTLKSGVIAGAVLIIILLLALFFIPAPEKSDPNENFIDFQEETQNTQIIVGYEKLENEKVSNALKVIVDGYVADFRQAAEEFGPSPTGRPYVLIVEDEEVFETDETIGVLLFVYQDFAGAHGIPRLMGHNFYKDTGEEVSLGDVLAISNWTLVAVAEGAEEYFTKKFGDSYFKEGIEAAEANYSSFLIKENEITFFFEPSRVAVYALGPQEYTISY